MLRRITYTVLVCLLVCSAGTAEWAMAYTVDNIYVTSSFSGLFAPATAQSESLIPEEPTAGSAPKTLAEPLARTDQPTLVRPTPGTSQRAAAQYPIAKVKPIHKVRPYSYGMGRYQEIYHPHWARFGQPGYCMLPKVAERGWGMEAEAFFARTKGKTRYARGTYAYQTGWTDSIDFNSDLALPEHGVLGTYSVSYRFRPRWSLKYSFMPMEANGSGTLGTRTFVFGDTTYNGTGYSNRVKFEQQTHMISLVYDPISNDRVRVGIAGGYVRVDDRLSLYQTGCCGDTLNMDMNMGFAGIEVEKCLKSGVFRQALSLVCKAGVSFGDDSFGSDLSTGLRYSIPMNKGRWGYLAGGYRFMTYKKKLSDIKEIDTAAEGGYLSMGFIF
ncbi:MAG: hypothetical protein AB1646_12155 [Thermodesulfobacteriota bacterium]